VSAKVRVVTGLLLFLILNGLAATFLIVLAQESYGPNDRQLPPFGKVLAVVGAVLLILTSLAYVLRGLYVLSAQAVSGVLTPIEPGGGEYQLSLPMSDAMLRVRLMKFGRGETDVLVWTNRNYTWGIIVGASTLWLPRPALVWRRG
jgi:hypothetical protein